MKKLIALALLIFSTTNAFAQDSKLEQMLDNYFAAMQTYVQTRTSKDFAVKEEAELAAEESKFLITNYFQEHFFKNAFRDSIKDFDRAGYEAALQQIQAQEKAHPNFIAELSVAIQDDWNQAFYDVFEMEQRRLQNEIRAPIRKALFFAGFAAAFGGSVRGLFFAAFKRVFPKKVTEVTLKRAATAAAVGTIAAYPATQMATALKAQAIKELPLPPAQVLTLTDEPAGLELADLEKEEFVKEVISSVAQIAGITWVSYLLMGTRLAQLGFAGTGIGIVIAIAAGFLINEIVTEAGDLYQEFKHKGALQDAIKKAYAARVSGNEHDQLKSTIRLTKAANKLYAFYQYQIYKGEMQKADSQNALSYQVLDFLSLVCTSEGGCEAREELDQVIALWLDNVNRAEMERERRSGLFKARIKKLPSDIFNNIVGMFSSEAPATPAVEAQIEPVQGLMLHRLDQPQKILDAAQTFLNQRSPKDFLSFRERLHVEKRIFQHRLASEVNDDKLSRDPNELMLQVSGFIRSLNKRFLNQFARKLEQSMDVEPLLAMSVNDEGAQ